MTNSVVDTMNMMINEVETPYVRIHPDVFIEEIAQSGEFVHTELSGGGFFEKDGMKFFYGAPVFHPSMRNSPMVSS